MGQIKREKGLEKEDDEGVMSGSLWSLALSVGLGDWRSRAAHSFYCRRDSEGIHSLQVFVQGSIS